ncbi:peroxin-13 [Schizosaccharomyces cryophilus OY26]|uniref:Peroxisomal membrane protein PEX13 n=1 Tax=Schizosaccharomyces cryophilus (strain OY26 / ATCC MYA-4695 / CBS 11777 / NBRC 106824 / NRRL Y48691) TaxID=653667 RepID=S9W101_SCHCR|nr:peroxin-13 [Schizosaccharomyces cryophilus OY26]EPY51735.1 peroxin-13 [Schizosaccharomyces cryophilus OY26]
MDQDKIAPTQAPELPAYPQGGLDGNVQSVQSGSYLNHPSYALGNRFYNAPGYMGLNYGNYPNFNSFLPSFNGIPSVESNGPTTEPVSSLRVIEGIVSSVGSIAQVMESTLMAAHMSYNTFVSVMENLSKLKVSIGSLFGIISLIRRLKRFIYNILGIKLAKPPNMSDYNSFDVEESKPSSKKSKLLSGVLFASLFVFPYVLIKMFKKIYEKEKIIAKEKNSKLLQDLEFCKAEFDFVPREPTVELGLKKGDIIAVLSKTDSNGTETGWWYGRKRNSERGWFPSNYCTVIPMKEQLDRVSTEIK